MKTTVLIPAYNEARTLRETLARVRAVSLDKEIVVVDDGSTDETAAVLEAERAADGDLRVVRHERNRGKGRAVLTGLEHARGGVTIIQDADLELDPQEIPRVVGPILEGRATAVYGTRFAPGAPAAAPVPAITRLGNRVVTAATNLLYGTRLSDEACGYKAMPTDLWRALDLRAERFELCAEITAKLRRRGVPIEEVPVSFTPRTVHQGKKVRLHDGLTTLATLVRLRFLP